MDLILASTSAYRRNLLERLQIPFSTVAPDVDETALPEESASALACRLAKEKSHAVAQRHPDALVIGSDQVASIAGRSVGKPGSHQAAAEQLQKSSGQQVDFYTGVALTCIATGYSQTMVERFSVVFRQLDPAEIEAYLVKEEPYDCAGSFKCEGLGIALFKKMIGDDPTSLEGLPLIATCRLLREAGVPVL
ncbi:MAG: Maf family nucleotide pyrophosphatase [Halioglobus sp.]